MSRLHLSSVEDGSILWTVWGQVDEEVELEELRIPGVPEALDLETLSEYDAITWSASLVRAGISVITSHAGKDPQKLLEAATENARLEVIRHKHRVEEVERDQTNLGRERLLPAEQILEKITCYEAHLSRQLYAALHELETLQTKRASASAPLASLDVQGMEG